MNVKVLSLALAVAIVALPVPASQMLATGGSSPAPAVHKAAGSDATFQTLLADPFLIDQMSAAKPASAIAFAQI